MHKHRDHYDGMERLFSPDKIIKDVPDKNVEDTISRQAAIAMCRKPRMRNADCSDFEMEIMMLPSAQPSVGKWIEKEAGTEDKEEGWETVIVCSRCDFPATTFYSKDGEERTQIRTRFCPNCGADMRKTT